MLSLQGFEDALQHAGWLRCGEYATKSPGGPVSILQLARVGEEGGHAARDLVADGPEAGVIERFGIGEVPIDAVVRRHIGARIAATHGDDHSQQVYARSQLFALQFRALRKAIGDIADNQRDPNTFVVDSPAFAL